MPGVEIDQWFVDQYAANILMLSQQKKSKFEMAVDVVPGIVGASKSVERIGEIEAYDITSRHGDTKYVEVPHTRRWLDLADSGVAALIDDKDQIRLLVDPTSSYVQSAVASLNRKKDDRIIAAMGGVVRAADDSGGLISFPASQRIVHGSTGMTMAKLRLAKQMFDEAEVDEDETRYLAMTAEQFNNLLSITEVTSSDYNSIKALVNGEINTYMGFEFIRSERLLKSSTTRACLAWARSGCQLGIGQDIVTKVTEMPNKNYATQIFGSMSLGGVRTEEKRVVEIECTETA